MKEYIDYNKLLQKYPDAKELFKNICLSYIRTMHMNALRFDKDMRYSPVKTNIYRVHIISMISFMLESGLIGMDEPETLLNRYVEDYMGG